MTREELGILAFEIAVSEWPEIMDLHTAARYMDRTYDTVWMKVKKQEIPAVVDGNRKFLRRCDIDAWAEKKLV